MAVARAQVRGFCKRWFSGGVSIPRTRVSSSQITDHDNDKFRFLDAVEGTPWPDSPFNRWDVFIKRSCLKGATQEEKMNFYVKTAAQILLSSEEEAKERIYKITADCSFDGFGLQIAFSRMYNFEGLRSIIDKKNLEIPVQSCWLTQGAVCFNEGELIRWSLISKRREKGRIPLPIPDAETESDVEE
ncbi:hypothetical protein CASFOL_003203 [Castilleja foliolosa]|uniref:MORF/ORRM1/DAG-like MORF domain-containing protein n=1 Tax=Castilleja foliolosa TaxID=1961234 RepID=A0ABD3EGH2_9LAMI